MDLNSHLIWLYRFNLEDQGRAWSTVAGSCSALYSLREFLRKRNCRGLLVAREGDIKAWLASIEAKGLALQSARSIFYGARSFFEWAEAEGLIAESPMNFLMAPGAARTSAKRG